MMCMSLNTEKWNIQNNTQKYPRNLKKEVGLTVTVILTEMDPSSEREAFEIFLHHLGNPHGKHKNVLHYNQYYYNLCVHMRMLHIASHQLMIKTEVMISCEFSIFTWTIMHLAVLTLKILHNHCFQFVLFYFLLFTPTGFPVPFFSLFFLFFSW